MLDIGGWQDPRSMSSRVAQPNYNGLPHSQGAGAPAQPNLGFDLETIQRRLLSSAAGYRI